MEPYLWWDFFQSFVESQLSFVESHPFLAISFSSVAPVPLLVSRQLEDVIKPDLPKCLFVYSTNYNCKRVVQWLVTRHSAGVNVMIFFNSEFFYSEKTIKKSANFLQKNFPKSPKVLPSETCNWSIKFTAGIYLFNVTQIVNHIPMHFLCMYIYV
jgi:hypothetical protein